MNYPINIENYKKYPIYKIFPSILQKHEPKNNHINNTKAKTSFGGRPKLAEINLKNDENSISNVEQIRIDEFSINMDKIEWILIEGQSKGIRK